MAKSTKTMLRYDPCQPTYSTIHPGGESGETGGNETNEQVGVVGWIACERTIVVSTKTPATSRMVSFIYGYNPILLEVFRLG
jgi:hypothetical protein